MQRSARTNRHSASRAVLAAVSIVVAMGMAFLYAPTEAVQGHVQRVFYIHVPTAWVSYLAFIVVAAASVLVLARPRLPSAGTGSPAPRPRSAWSSRPCSSSPA